MDQKIILENVSKSFGNTPVLQGVNLAVESGTTLVILGRSGVGKSVLLKCIVGLLVPEEGHIFIDGVDITVLNRDELNKVRRNIGYVFQNAALYDSLTVCENLEFPVKRLAPEISAEACSELVLEKLRFVGLEDALDKYPQDLSGGMQKRIGLARSIMLDPDIVLYDEPTTGLDPITSDEISKLIRKLQQEHAITSIVITHDMKSTLTVADDVAILDKGTINTVVPVEQVFDDPDPVLHEFLTTSVGMEQTERE